MAESSVTPLADLLGLADRELVSLVGGGGKTTLLFGLGGELAAAGRTVLLTTTTKMGRDQALAAPSVGWSDDLGQVTESLGGQGPVMLVIGGDDHKVTGPSPEVIDRLFAESVAEYVIVEADGSRGRPLKAPGDHEPVIPSESTTVVVLMGIDAVGRPLEAVTHRVEQAMRFSGRARHDLLTPSDCAAIIAHPDGALGVCPPMARVVVAITKVRDEANRQAAADIVELLRPVPRISDVVIVPASDPAV